MSNFVFVPTRRHSTRFPGKNVRPFLGRPLVAITIEQALRCETVDEVVCVSDDPAVLGMADELGAKLVVLPDRLTTDSVNPTSGVMHAVEVLGLSPSDRVALIHVTNPLRADEDIDGCFRRLNEGFDSALTVTRRIGNFFGSLDEDGTYHPSWDVVNPPRTQDLDMTYCLTGGVYATSAGRLLEHRTWLSGRVAGVEVPRYRMDDINTAEDFAWCEMVAKVLMEMKT